MQLMIGSNTIDVVSCTRLRDVQRGFYLDIKILRSTIGMDDLIAIFDGNTEPIYVLEGEIPNEYIGFKTLSNISLENGIYHVMQACTSEIEAQLSLVQNKSSEQDVKINSLNIALTNANQVITEQAMLLAEQVETSAELLFQICLVQLGMTEDELF